ncbi:hypothetical protein DL98DRAFT_532629 [Cadophora sp. DSE1049]|nr:hypothetical protein DL98DRAFT_532629 [Cadophora sp. DSE1049]
MTSTTTSRMRDAQSIRLLRTRSPYLNWFDGSFYDNTHSHPTQRDPLISPPQLPVQKSWATEKPMGSRHILDTAPFSLWDDEKQDYTKPTPMQRQWIQQTYGATEGTFSAPFLIVATQNPSLAAHNGHVSLTLGCCPVIFMPPQVFQNATEFGLPVANGANLVDRNIQDLLHGVFEIPKWQRRPSKDQVIGVLQILHEFCRPVAVNFVSPNIIVELSTKSTCSGQSLPGVLAGRRVHYHVGTYWNEPTMRARLRNVQAEDWENFPRGDTTNYLRTADGTVGPGIRVEGETRSSSSGVRIRKGTEVRVMLAEHAVKDSEHLYHPDGFSGDNVADIVERTFPDGRLKMALVNRLRALDFQDRQILFIGQHMKIQKCQ